MMNARDRMFLDINFRVNPNTDIVGGAALRRPAVRGPPRSGLARGLRPAHRSAHAGGGGADADLDQPTAPAAPVLTWGDSRIGNLLFEGQGVEVTALLDWEFACHASPAHDIAHWLYAQRYFTEGIGTPLPSGIPDRSETIAIYEGLTGLSLDDLPYDDVTLAVNGAINGMRVAAISIEAGWLPPDTDLGLESGGTHILRRLLGDQVAQSSRSFAKS